MYSVDISNKGDYLFSIKSKDYNFVIDIKGRGVTPPDTLLASIGSCIGVYIRKYAEGFGIKLKDFGINVEADFTKEPPAHFKNINVSVDLKGLEIGERRKDALIEFVKNCPVHNTLKANPDIEIKIL